MRYCDNMDCNDPAAFRPVLLVYAEDRAAPIRAPTGAVVCDVCAKVVTVSALCGNTQAVRRAFEEEGVKVDRISIDFIALSSPENKEVEAQIARVKGQN